MFSRGRLSLIVCDKCARRFSIASNGQRLYSKAAAKRAESTTKWEPVIGLEVHAQIASNSKLFSRGSTQYGGRTNSQVALFDAAYPGTLPVLNRRCVEAGVSTALAIGCNVNFLSQFDRKHYFYADLPAGYQITQQRLPLASGGSFTYLYQPNGPGTSYYEYKSVRFIQLQLEQDSGKSLHDHHMKRSLIDLNRCGTALMEIVTEPDFRSSHEASGFIRELKRVLEAIGACDGKMEEGSLRVDASISVHHPNEPLGTRVEVKNLNSMKFVSKAISYEINRQIKTLENGGVIESETRTFDLSTGETLPMRDKEKVHDYRFMPEPNLPPLHVYNDVTAPSCLDPSQIVNVDEIRRNLPPLPAELRNKLTEDHGMSLQNADMIVHTEGMLPLFTFLANERKLPAGLCVKVLLNILLGVVNSADLSFSDCSLMPSQVAEVIGLLNEGELSQANAKRVFATLLNEEHPSIEKLIEERNWGKISDEELLAACQDVTQRSPKEVRKYLTEKKERSFNSLLGRVHKATNKRTESHRIRKMLLEQCLPHFMSK
ncbi:hypothetical protein CAPTEDRAFT_197011 [Capitella teleta]|uniref:Glutamyl-tRNA(Gln) amidotransferase subunit B, mitochondrial n=1 Tax=Capitella teleta TaxID=283909 RepID=R7V577_CAPTE|nr:hypothetical protein CAPTEDRAFT_197011 [Capitella teleta]|eukprot:ELU14023.1 hypothetical protein CAPTEDRAFT_197011 [Capitella teleta]